MLSGKSTAFLNGVPLKQGDVLSTADCSHRHLTATSQRVPTEAMQIACVRRGPCFPRLTTRSPLARSTEAKALMLQAVEKSERVLGPEHPQTLRACKRLREIEGDLQDIHTLNVRSPLACRGTCVPHATLHPWHPPPTHQMLTPLHPTTQWPRSHHTPPTALHAPHCTHSSPIPFTCQPPTHHPPQ